MSVVYWTWQQKDHWFAKLQDQIARSWGCHHFCRAKYWPNQFFVDLQVVDVTSGDIGKTSSISHKGYQWSLSSTWMIEDKYHMIHKALSYSTNQKLLRPCFEHFKIRFVVKEFQYQNKEADLHSNFHNFLRTFALLELSVVKKNL